MPGIVGIIGSKPAGEKSSVLQQMLKCMMHEPSYASGTYMNERLGLFVGWVAHAGSFSDCMPVWNETGDVCLIFTGEDFRDAGEAVALRARGHACDLETASYLVHLYEETGPGFFEKLNGWFSGLLVDLREHKVILFNDRYGLGRVYCHENASGFYFSSEAKSLLKVLPQLRHLDLAGLAETFSCGCVLQNRTLFTGISLVPGGSKWTFDKDRAVKKESYFTPEIWEQQPPLGDEAYYERLKETFARILPRYLRGRQRVAMSLTGGLDGRMIMAWADRAPGTLPCYSFGSAYRENTDVRIARQVARICKQPHETIVVDSGFFPNFLSLAEKAVFVSDGTMDVTGSVELYVNGIASRAAPVRLTGNYGSEIVRGSIAFRPGIPKEKLLPPDFAQRVRAASAVYRTERECRDLSFIAFKQVPWYHYSRLSVEASALTMRTPYLDNELVSLMYQAPRELISCKIPSLRLIADGNPDLARIPTDRGLLYRPMPVVTACRHRYEEFTFKAEYAYDYGMPEWLARIDHVLRPLHPERLFLGRHKFYHFRVWYRDKLSQTVKNILLDPRALSRGYLNRRHVEDIVADHAAGRMNHTSEIHMALTAELVQRTLIEGL